MVEYVTLVDHHDQMIGQEEKLKAHQQGLCHRAFSVFLFRYNDQDQLEVLLQQRALGKYHSPGLWTNTCCSHPRPGEATDVAAKRRLLMEMGIEVDQLTPVGKFHYRHQFDNGLVEDEVDHVLMGWFDSNEVNFNRDEVEAVKWVEVDQLNGERYTVWFQEALSIALTSIKTE